jgi:hypothetical protein
MTKLDWIILLLIAILALCLLWFAFIADKRREEREDRLLKEAERNRISEDNVRKEQLEFEKRLDMNVDLPDGIRWQKAYIYRHLMSKWFDDLTAKHRYDELMANKIRRDWLTYMALLERHETSSFLSAESSAEDSRDAYDRHAWEERKSFMAVEDAFAAAIGVDAVEELRIVRAKQHDAFDRTGQKEIAPMGFRYFPISINPYIEELRPSVIPKSETN